MSDGTELGDRMKFYESFETHRKIMPLTPVMARMDGKAFHAFTKGMTRPFDMRFLDLMKDTLHFLMGETGACFGYTQSDEISLCWFHQNLKTQNFMGGKIQKMVSILSSLTSVFFNQHLGERIPEKSGSLPIFDCKVNLKYSPDEMVKLPPQHEARKNPDLMVERTQIRELELEDLTSLSNRVGVIFHGEDPQWKLG